ncbi:hypothetical protein [uncultured Dokdonia sp.]|uniref:hypothetical protein n=1 Tax=uncultured Dokdonia sp. TaxID=575653 RepID=UPI002604FBF0|nr:hypothetical protein [uncultured Dokdonia sp.]
MNKEDIKNWKLVEHIEDVDIIDSDSNSYFKSLAKKLDIPLTNFKDVNRENTNIDWQKMSNHFKFFFDNEGEENEIEIALKKSNLSQKKKIIILYGTKEAAITIPVSIFISEWEDFIASTQWETLIFSDDYELIIEISRDYFMHSNFKIK